mgnify:CR=1 FL=1
MTAYECVELFRRQLERRTGLKVVLVPSPVKDSGPVVRIALRKVLVANDTVGNRRAAKREVKLTVALDGRVESATGLRLACDAIESVAAFLRIGTRLETAEGDPIPEASITSTINPDDGVLEDPDSGAVAWIRDEHFVVISMPL